MSGTGSPAQGGRRKVYEALVDAFVAQGVTVIFNVIGYGNRHFLQDAASQGIRLVNVRHEGAGLAMADGYARAGGAVGVCSVHYGPGTTQLSTSMMVANKHRTPIVVFAADLPRDMRDASGPLDFDERGFFGSCGATVVELRRKERVAKTVERAFTTARARLAPVVLLAPVDLQLELSDADEFDTTIPEVVHGDLLRIDRAVPPRNALADIASVLREATRPVVLAGRGAASHSAKGLAVELADHFGALLATTFESKGLFDDHPRSVGAAGAFALRAHRELLEEADCVLAVGASLNSRTTAGGMLFSKAQVIHIDHDPSSFEREDPPASWRLLGDAEATLHALREEIASDEPQQKWPRTTLERLERSDAREAEIAANPVETDPGSVDPRALMLALDRVIPGDAVVVVGGGHCMGFAAQYLRNPSARSFEMVFDFMTTGQAVPSAIGAAVAQPERMVVAIEGDASALMHVQELETAARSGISFLLVVLNDGALGAEYHDLVRAGLNASAALAPTPPLGRVCEALGGAGLQLTNVAEVDSIMDWYDPKRGPHLVDCTISRAVVAP